MTITAISIPAGLVSAVPMPAFNQWRGNWNQTTIYLQNDLVFRSPSTYRALTLNTNDDPALASGNWTLAALGLDPTPLNAAVATATNARDQAAASATSSAASATLAAAQISGAAAYAGQSDASAQASAASAVQSQTAAGVATTAAGQAGASATAAAGSKTAAATSETNAGASATSAAASAAAAQASAQSAAAGGVAPTGTFTSGHLVIAKNTSGSQVGDSGIDPATLATSSGVSSAISAAIAGLSSFPVSGIVAQNGAVALAASDKGKLFDLTGSFTVTLPAASAASASAPLYYHFRKRDGSGRVLVACAGSDTFASGVTSLSVYQEDLTLVSFGGPWYAPPGGRQRGWIAIGSTTIASAVASVAFTTGFSDSELREIELDFNGVSLSANGYIAGQVIKGGTTLTSNYVYSGIFSGGAGTPSGIGSSGAASAFPLCGNGSTGYPSPYAATVNLANVLAAGGNQRVKFQYSSGVSGGAGFGEGEGFQNTAGAITGLVFSPDGSKTFTGGTFNQKGYRP